MTPCGHLRASRASVSASPLALKAHQPDSPTLGASSYKSLTELAAMYNPCIRGWLNYYITRRSCVQPSSGSTPMSFGGHAASSSGCVIGPKARETGLPGSAGRTRSSLRTGCYAVATAEHREPCESRGSCTVVATSKRWCVQQEIDLPGQKSGAL